jgi:rare lipoprotein A
MSRKRIAATLLSTILLGSPSLVAPNAAQASSQSPSSFSLPFMPDVTSGTASNAQFNSVQVASVIETNPLAPIGSSIQREKSSATENSGELFTIKSVPGHLSNVIQVLPQSLDSTSLYVNTVEVLRLSGTTAQGSSYKRVCAIASALRVSMLSNSGNAANIRINPKASNSLLINNTPLLTVSAEAAKQLQDSPKNVTLLFGNRLRAALGYNSLVLPVTEEVKKSAEAKSADADKDSDKGEKKQAYKSTGRRYTGVASWYGPHFHGRKTASGKRFNMYAMTAAHRSLPFGTLVRVVNQTNHKTCIVQINDRGPYAHGRIIDLSKGAARAIDMSGTAKVALEVIHVASD